jgi:hypothetical protein
MITKEEIIECGWEYNQNICDLPEIGFLYEINRGFTQWEMHYNSENGKMQIEKIFDSGVEGIVLDCKIHNKEELLGEMAWLNIKQK